MVPRDGHGMMPRKLNENSEPTGVWKTYLYLILYRQEPYAIRLPPVVRGGTLSKHRVENEEWGKLCVFGFIARGRAR